MLNKIINTYTLFWDSTAIPFLLRKIPLLPKPIMNLITQAELGQLYTGVLHDLSSPLTAVLFHLGTEHALSGNNILTETLTHIKQLLQLARRSHNPSICGTISVTESIQNAQGLLSHKALSSGVRISTYVEQSIFLYGKQLAFQQILTNLLSNAIDAYMETNLTTPTVTITATQTASAVVITVHDKGVGISKQKMKHIFTPLYTTKNSGNGLGLTLIKQLIIFEFSGTISVKSDPANGTYFIVKIPKSKNSPQS